MSDEKISQFPTLANPPLAPVFDAVITNDGTTATNFQRPQGQITQPVNSAHGIVLKGPAITGPGTAIQAAPPSSLQGGTATAAATGHQNQGGDVYLASGGAITAGTLVAGGAQIYLTGGKVLYNNLRRGGKINVSGAAGDYGGSVYLRAGGSSGTNLAGGYVYINAGNGGPNASGGSIVLGPGAAGAGGTANGVVLISTIGTVDPHVLGGTWQKATTPFTLYRSQG